MLSETDVHDLPLNRRPDSDVFRRWEVAGAAHSGWEGREYRIPLEIRDFGAETIYTCTNPPFSRVWLSQVIEAAYGHLARWVDGGAPPPLGAVPGVQRADDEGTECARTGPRRHPAVAGRRADRAQHRLELGAVVLPALRDACPVQRLPQLASLYRNHGSYVSGVRAVDRDNEGCRLPDSRGRARESARSCYSDVGK